MKAKLFAIPKTILTRLIDLEAQTMIPVLAQSGIYVTKEEIAAEIYKDQEQEVLLTLRADNPLAWVRYGMQDGRLFVKSIQLSRHSNSLGMLRGLLREALIALKNMSTVEIESVVQTANTQSLEMHEKLGFARVKEGTKAIRFSINSKVLVTNLQRLVGTE